MFAKILYSSALRYSLLAVALALVCVATSGCGNSGNTVPEVTKSELEDYAAQRDKARARAAKGDDEEYDEEDDE